MASIETRTGPRGTSYKVVWYDDAGRKKSKTWHNQTQADAWRRLIESVRGDEARAIQHLARQASQAPTVEKVATHRLGLLRGTDFSRQTYESYMRNHIGPALGDWPVDTVGEDDCRRFVIALERKKLSPKYITNICGWLVSIFRHAEERGWRQGVPMKPGMLPEVTRSDADEADMFLTLAEAEAIIARMPERHRDPAGLMLATGLRPSEMRALTVGDAYLDVQQPVVRVTKAIKQNREKGSYVGPPKSKRAVRSLGIPPSVVAMLRPHVAGRRSDEYLFPDGHGSWLPESTFYQAFTAGVGRARAEGLLAKNPSPYSLRHTHASLMLDAGMDLWKLSRHMGHGSQQVTENVYAHLMPDAHYQAAAFAQKALES
ncbi:tyrosine-type recombinase/integrase [Occultella kanbiaonis]|uniref:tyrosine-type recombinase/integrase n=1 Tax=Occultella kanbiaonis TaxID=2675754 RepID=UPI0013D1CBEF|nr:site-specific integrase [Occultella kanbiaonis]